VVLVKDSCKRFFSLHGVSVYMPGYSFDYECNRKNIAFKSLTHCFIISGLFIFISRKWDGKEMNELKQKLHELCYQYINDRSQALKKEMDDIQDSANNETKSTAGDKYETGREMMQQEIDMKNRQLLEVLKLRSVLDRIDPSLKTEKVVAGSIVDTNNGNYYIAASCGQFNVAGMRYYTISAESPIGLQLMGKKVGDSFEFNGRQYDIKQLN
jgi:transcription elongation GreA/GreB family factor